jgi:hypothetical protein
MFRKLLVTVCAALTVMSWGCSSPSKVTVSVSVSPSVATLKTGDTQSFSAAVVGSSDPEVSWTVQEAEGGSVTAAGLYTAPAIAGVYHVVAASHADPTVTAAATVTVSPKDSQIVVTVTPGMASVSPGGMVTFAAMVVGAETPAVTWSVSEATGGTISAEGVYTAPAMAGHYTVVATSVADPTRSGSAAVTVASSPIAVSVTPPVVNLPEGQTKQFVAMVTGTANTAVTWSVREGPPGGMLNSSGSDCLYTAPGTVGTYHLIATSVADPTQSGVATVAVTATTFGGIAGTVAYTGPKTGRVYVVAYDANNYAVAGTSLPGKGSFTLRGLKSGTYQVMARMDTLGNGLYAAAADPIGRAQNVTVGSTATVITMSDPSAQTLTAPMTVSVFPGDRSALVSWSPLVVAGTEAADHYRVFWGAAVDPSDVAQSVLVPANTPPQALIASLTNGSPLYFSVAGVNNGTLGPVKGTAAAISIGAPTASPTDATVSGTVSSSGLPAPGPLIVVLSSSTASYFTRIDAPTTSQAYTFTAVAPGSYKLFAFFDGGGNGFIDGTDPSNLGKPVSVSVSGAGTVTAPAMTFTFSTQTAAVWSGWDAVGSHDSLSFRVRAGVKLPVNVVLNAAANVPGTLDLPVNGVASGEHEVFFQVPSKPIAGQSFSLSIEFADGSTETASVALSGVFTDPPGNLSPSNGSMGVSKTPTLSWSPPPSGTNPTATRYYIWVSRTAATDVQWSTYTTSTSIAWNADGKAAVPTLAGSTSFVVYVYAEDPAGDYSVTGTVFTTAP